MPSFEFKENTNQNYTIMNGDNNLNVVQMMHMNLQRRNNKLEEPIEEGETSSADYRSEGEDSSVAADAYLQSRISKALNDTVDEDENDVGFGKSDEGSATKPALDTESESHDSVSSSCRQVVKGQLPDFRDAEVPILVSEGTPESYRRLDKSTPRQQLTCVRYKETPETEHSVDSCSTTCSLSTQSRRMSSPCGAKQQVLFAEDFAAEEKKSEHEAPSLSGKQIKSSLRKKDIYEFHNSNTTITLTTESQRTSSQSSIEEEHAQSRVVFDTNLVQYNIDILDTQELQQQQGGDMNRAFEATTPVASEKALMQGIPAPPPPPPTTPSTPYQHQNNQKARRRRRAAQSRSISRNSYSGTPPYNPFSCYSPDDRQRRVRRREVMGMSILAFLEYKEKDVDDESSSHCGSDESVAMDSESEEAHLEAVARQIHSDLLHAEMIELAMEAEKAADAGEETFAIKPSMYRLHSNAASREKEEASQLLSLSPNSYHGSTSNTPYSDYSNEFFSTPQVPRPTPLRKRRASYSEGTRISLLRREQQLQQQSVTKLRVVDLRDVNEVFPIFAEFHKHMRTHFLRNGCSEDQVFFQELSEDKLAIRSRQSDHQQLRHHRFLNFSRQPTDAPLSPLQNNQSGVSTSSSPLTENGTSRRPGATSSTCALAFHEVASNTASSFCMNHFDLDVLHSSHRRHCGIHEEDNEKDETTTIDPLPEQGTTSVSATQTESGKPDNVKSLNFDRWVQNEAKETSDSGNDRNRNLFKSKSLNCVKSCKKGCEEVENGSHEDLSIEIGDRLAGHCVRKRKPLAAPIFVPPGLEEACFFATNNLHYPSKNVSSMSPTAPPFVDRQREKDFPSSGRKLRFRPSQRRIEQFRANNRRSLDTAASYDECESTLPPHLGYHVEPRALFDSNAFDDNSSSEESDKDDDNRRQVDYTLPSPLEPVPCTPKDHNSYHRSNSECDQLLELDDSDAPAPPPDFVTPARLRKIRGVRKKPMGVFHNENADLLLPKNSFTESPAGKPLFPRRSNSRIEASIQMPVLDTVIDVSESLTSGGPNASHDDLDQTTVTWPLFLAKPDGEETSIKDQNEDVDVSNASTLLRSISPVHETSIESEASIFKPCNTDLMHSPIQFVNSPVVDTRKLYRRRRSTRAILFKKDAIESNLLPRVDLDSEGVTPTVVALESALRLSQDSAGDMPAPIPLNGQNEDGTCNKIEATSSYDFESQFYQDGKYASVGYSFVEEQPEVRTPQRDIDCGCLSLSPSSGSEKSVTERIDEYLAEDDDQKNEYTMSIRRSTSEGLLPETNVWNHFVPSRGRKKFNKGAVRSITGFSPRLCGNRNVLIQKSLCKRAKDNDEFLNNFLYCTRNVEVEDKNFVEHETMCAEPCQDANDTCGGYSNAKEYCCGADHYSSILSKIATAGSSSAEKKNSTNARPLLRLGNTADSSQYAMDPENWINIASEKIDALFDRFIGETNDMENPNNLFFQAPSLKKKDELFGSRRGRFESERNVSTDNSENPMGQDQGGDGDLNYDRPLSESAGQGSFPTTSHWLRMTLSDTIVVTKGNTS